ncbi:MAG: biotin--[acetyl-CoA-carboxylase] ligase [Coriobacteriia bacterium]|nr:biotin--[acetyl-CoA-carboxylase] ligase [Coriobacteriia bacterium]
MNQTPGALDATEVHRHLTSDMWVRIETAAETGSTSDDAAALARAGTPHGTAVLASRQTDGRGRLGRRWESPAGGVYVSAVVRPMLPAADLTALPLAVAVGVAGAITRLGGDARVKWPNDVLVSGGKVAGVLLELNAAGGRADWLVIGVGLNVSRPLGGHTEGRTYLADHVRCISCTKAAAMILDGIAEGYRLLVDDGVGAIRGALGVQDVLSGSEVTVREADGSVLARGRAEGIDDVGRLLLAGEDGRMRAIASGDVTLRDTRRGPQESRP